MTRIVINKHFPDYKDITKDVFDSIHGEGEIIISNDVGFEGLYVLNTDGKVVRINSTSDVNPEQVKDIISSLLEDNYMTSAQTYNLVADVSGVVVTIYDSVAELSGAVETILEQGISGGTINENAIRVIAKDEASKIVAEVVASADTSFDTLKEIADWIQNDTTGAASMANDIADLKAIDAGTRLTTLEAISGQSHTHDNKIILDSISADKVESWDKIEENTKKYTDKRIDEVKDTIKEVSGYIFQPLSESQYKKLLEIGEIIIIDNNTGEKKLVIYDDNTYYMIFEDLVEPDIINENEIVLENNWTPFDTIIVNSGSKKINLNNHKIIAPEFIDETDNSTNSYGLWVKGGNITIEGDGEVIAQDAEYSMAVWANGGTITINSGTFRNGGDSCDLIYASNGGNVYIYGGEFIAKGPASGTEPGTKNPYSILNIKDKDRDKCEIKVYGGRFFKFNPADNVSEGNNTNFVAEGYKSVQDGEWWVVVKNENE